MATRPHLYELEKNDGNIQDRGTVCGLKLEIQQNPPFLGLHCKKKSLVIIQ